MMIRGVYSDWSVVLQQAQNYHGGNIDAAWARRLESMAATGVNLIWWTNLPNDPTRLATIVRECRSRSIECVIGSGYWYIGDWNYTVSGIAATQHAVIVGLLAAMPITDRPLAWSISDEPGPAAVPVLRQLATLCETSGIRTAVVQVPEYHADTIDGITPLVPLVSCDVYPFFQAGLPSNPPYGAAAISRTIGLYQASISRTVRSRMTPVIMTQGFGESSLFALPSVSQTRWQIWAAIALGSQGAIVFAHGLPTELAGESIVNLATETLTPQGAAVAVAFARIAQLDSLAGSTAEAAPAWQGTPASGDLVTVRRTTAGRRVLIIVADPDQPSRTLRITLPGVTSITPMAGSTGAGLSVLPWPWWMWFPPTLSVSLQPGDAWIGGLN